MPAWMTSLLREEIPVPMPSAASATMTACPRRASARATASPTTPAPMMSVSTLRLGQPPDRARQADGGRAGPPSTMGEKTLR
ncbi:MAG TPA: hypothetical protein VHG30_09565 [Microvirga sp.]|nr:hypothetical protein [Microvirga sp.]